VFPVPPVTPSIPKFEENKQAEFNREREAQACFPFDSDEDLKLARWTMESLISRGDFDILIRMLKDKNFDLKKITLSKYADIEKALGKIPVTVVFLWLFLLDHED